MSMVTTNQPKLSKYIDYVVATSTANCEEDSDDLLKLMRPTEDRWEMGTVYSNLLGYNPITYFDEAYVRRMYAQIVEDAPANIRHMLKDNEEDYINQAMAIFADHREGYLLFALTKVITDETGWSDPNIQVSDVQDDDSTPAGFELDDDNDENEDEDDDEEDDDDDDDDELDSEDNF